MKSKKLQPGLSIIRLISCCLLVSAKSFQSLKRKKYLPLENGNAAGGQKGGLFKTLYKDLGQMATDVKEGVKGFIDEKRPAAKEHRQGIPCYATC